MTICQALLWANKILNKNIQTNEGDFRESRLRGFGIDAEILLSYALKKSRGWLFVNDKCQMPNDKFSKFQTLIRRRMKGVPVAYLTNHKEFYGLDFYVDERVLVPRPETEMLTDFAIHWARNMIHDASNKGHLTIADVGTGSGCIAISVAKNLIPNASSLIPNALSLRPHPSSPMPQIYATDISQDALTVARRNARKHKTKIHFLHGDLLEPIIKRGIKPDIIIGNLPYLKPSQIRGEIKFEPREALVGGRDGLRYYERLLGQIQKKLLFINYYLLFEIDPSQTEKIKKLIKRYLPKSRIEIKKDLARMERVAVIHDS